MSEESAAQSSKESPQSDEVVVNRSNEEYARKLKEVSLEAKGYRQKMSEMKDLVDKMEKERLSKEGQKDELLKRYENENAEFKNAIQKKTLMFANQLMSTAIKAEAAQAGCLKVDDLIKLTDLSQVEIDDDLNVSYKSVQNIIAEHKKERPHMFKKDAPQIKDGIPQNKPESGPTKKPTLDELAMTLASMKK